MATHSQAWELHRRALFLLQQAEEPPEGRIVPGGLYWDEKQYDEADVRSWEVTRELLPEGNFRGQHWEAMDAHWEADYRIRAHLQEEWE